MLLVAPEGQYGDHDDGGSGCPTTADGDPRAQDVAVAELLPGSLLVDASCGPTSFGQCLIGLQLFPLMLVVFAQLQPLLQSGVLLV